MSAEIDVRSEAEQFIRSLFKVYLEDRDFPKLISMLHKDITWFGTGEFEVCKSYQDALSLLEKESNSWDGRYKILKQWYEMIPLSEEKCVVFGEIEIAEDGLNIILMNMKSRFSMICAMEAGKMKLYHAHFSVPNIAQKENEFVHKTLMENYNTLLEEKLLERTMMLKEKTAQLETFTNNIFGGVQICEFDDGFTIEYISRGFSVMTGYTKDEIDILFNGRHLGLVYPSDRDNMVDSIKKQLETDNHFTLEYRMVRKDGQEIWVMDKGTLIQEDELEVKIQCTLTDITVSKQHEAALQLSEKRYEIAMKSSGLTMFEYNVLSGELILFESEANSYDVPTVIPNGVQTLIQKRIIEQGSVPAYKEMYRQIHSGALYAKCYIKSRDKYGEVYDYELSLTNVFDSKGVPVRAIGVRTNVSHMLGLQKEREFGKNLVSDKKLIFEVDITTNQIEYLQEEWEEPEFRDKKTGFDQYISRIADKHILTEHKELFLQMLSTDYIKNVLETESNLYTFAYKQKDREQNYIWHEATVNIIKDNMTDHIYLRCYQINIGTRKRKEQKAYEEKQLYQAMLAKAILAYEVNITKNLAMKGHEHWKEQYKIAKSDDYELMIKEFSKKGTHADDGKEFYDTFCRENVLEMFEGGIRRLSCQYRKQGKSGTYRWVKCSLHLYEEIDTNDIKGYSYVEDIDEQKREELALKYCAEHDSMTGMFNKTITEQKINEYLKSKEGNAENHALLIIDIDYFKYINDNFGHLFGDGVIKEIASKIRSVCRDNDIIGRIGGDEFCIFMKNISNQEAVAKKAQSICQKIKRTYSRDGKTCTISASVGISIYQKNGWNYEELCIHADRALYAAKGKGRDRYEISEATETT